MAMSGFERWVKVMLEDAILNPCAEPGGFISDGQLINPITILAFANDDEARGY